MGILDVSATWALVVLGALLLVLLPKRNAVKAARFGIDPGLLGFKTVPGKLYFLIKGHEVVKARYEKAKNEPYYLQATNVDRLVLPPRYLQELQIQSSSTLSGSVASVQNTLGEYSGVDVILKDRQSHDICKTRLTKSLPTLVPHLAECLKRHVQERLEGRNGERIVFQGAHELMLSLNATVSSHLYVGPILLQDKAFMKAWVGIQPAIASVIIALTFCPRWLRSLIGPHVPPVKRLKALHKEIQTFLFPKGGILTKCEYPTIFEHYVATAKVLDEEDIAAKFSLLTTNSLHTLTNAATQALFDLCLNPKIVPELRREIEVVLDKTGGEWTMGVLKELRLMDSFIKESSRCNPHAYLGFNRVLLTDVVLLDGLRLPKGQFISFPEESMLHDAEFFDDPDTFDPYRYCRKRAVSGDENSPYELTGIDEYNLNWGYGKGTCPGRWYAAAVMKLMLGIILTEYHVCFPDGQRERPANEYLDTMIQPCRKQQVVFEKLVA